MFEVPRHIADHDAYARDGNDGPWSSFTVQVGSPSQNVRVLISSSGSSLWTVVPDGCTKNDAFNCAELRGRVFNPNASSTWTDKGLFSLPFLAEQSLGYTGNGQFGFDTITLGLQGSGGPKLDHQVIAGFATKDVYTGMLGMTSRGTNFTDFNNPEPSILTSLRNQGKIASSTWSYTAGAQYTPKKTFGSLTFGGYDSTRRVPNNVTITFGEDISRDLLVGIQSINSGSDSLLPNGTVAFVDSTVSHIWLPLEACKRFEEVFGLTWNSSAQLYLVSDALHDSLIAKNASIKFTLGATSSGGQTVNITFPYAAFDLTVSGPPLLNGTSRYFPLKRAANDTQYTLGRAFLQEAYLTVDYDRSTFTLAQALFPDSSVPQRLVPILSPSASTSDPSSSSPSSSKTGLSTGAIAGIVVGALALLLIPLIAWLLIRRRRRRTKAKKSAAAATHDDDNTHSPALDTDNAVGLGYKAELDARDTTFRGHEVPADESSFSHNDAKMKGSEAAVVGPGYDDEKAFGYGYGSGNESGNGNGNGVGGQRQGQGQVYEMRGEEGRAPVFEMSAEQEVREMDGGYGAGQGAAMVGRRADLDGGRR